MRKYILDRIQTSHKIAKFDTLSCYIEYPYFSRRIAKNTELAVGICMSKSNISGHSLNLILSSHMQRL